MGDTFWLRRREYLKPSHATRSRQKIRCLVLKLNLVGVQVTTVVAHG